MKTAKVLTFCLMMVVILTLAALWPSTSLASPGDRGLDPAFGTDGIVTTNLSGDDGAIGMARQGDGKIIVSAHKNSELVLLRYTTNGTLDNTFSGNGKLFTGLDAGNGLAIQDDGKIVVAGFEANDVRVRRYLPDGTQDGSLTGLGNKATDFGSGNNWALQADGKIVYADGEWDVVEDDADILLRRYLTSGALDPSFGAGGVVTADIGGNDYAHAVLIQSNGKILMVGSAGGGENDIYNDKIALLRYDPDGTPDTTFGDDGAAVTNVPNLSMNQGEALIIDRNNRIVVAGMAHERLFH